jgi:hypothetical protein
MQKFKCTVCNVFGFGKEFVEKHLHCLAHEQCKDSKLEQFFEE